MSSRLLGAALSVVVAAALAVVPGHAAAATTVAETPAPRTTVTFTDTHEVLHGNPYTGTAFDINSPKPAGQRGWVFADDPAITAFIDGKEKIPDEADIVRLQIAWADFEPDDDAFTWDRLDAFMKRIVEQGKTVEFQLLMSEAPDIENDPSVFAYEYPPAWLFDKLGAGFRLAPYNTVYKSRQPIYHDPIYLAELKEAVGAFAARYDTNPGMAWVDLRAFALFGEWSGWNDAMNFPWPDNATRSKTLRAIIDIYADAFTRTMVMMPNPGADVVATDPDADTQAKRYVAFGYDQAARNENWGLRSDTVNSAFPWMQYGTGSESVWINRKLRRDLIQVSEGAGWDSGIMLNNPRLVVKNALEAYHSNLQGINNTSFAQWQAMKDAYGEWFTTLGRYSGYRFVMPRATYDSQVTAGGRFTLAHTWTNNGVGFSPRKYPLEVRFTDRATGEVVWRGTDDSLDQTKWFKGDVRELRSAFALPAGVPAGTYDVGVAMLGADGKPRIELAMPDGAGKVYPIGTIKVVPEVTRPAALAGPLTQFRIENEDYTEAKGAYGVEAPPEGGFGSVYLDEAGEWAEYDNVVVPASGTYRAEFRVSSEQGNRFRVEVDGRDALGTVTVPDSGGYNVYRTVERDLTLPEGRHTIRIIREDGRWFFMNWMRFTRERPESITIQAEKPTAQEGVWLAAEDAVSDDGTPGVSVVDTGDWLRYDDVEVPASGDYLLQFQYSTVNADPLTFRVEVDGTDVSGGLSLRDTGGVNRVRTEDFVLPLTAGTHSIKVVWTEAHSNIVWNRMRFDLQGAAEQTIEAEHYTMQWNLGQEWAWKGADTGVVVGTYQGADGPVRAVGHVDEGDYLRYENVLAPHTGLYRVAFTAASGKATSFRFEVDGDRYPVHVPDTGGDGHFTTVGTWVKLTAGAHTFRIVAEGTGLLLDAFTVTAGTAATKALVATGATALKAGQTATITTEAVHADGSRTPVSDGVTYVSSDPSVATVDAHGVVKAASWGSTTITAIYDGLSDGYSLTVTDPALLLTHVNDDDPRVTYSGAFGVDRGRGLGDYGDDVHYSTEKGDYAELTFTGTGISFLTERYTDMGVVDLYVDGELRASADCYGPVRQGQQRVFRASGLKLGEHTIRVVNRQSAADTGRIAIVDAFVVEVPRPWADGAELTVTKKQNSVRLAWPRSPIATGYAVFDGDTEVARVPANKTKAKLAALAPGSAHTLTVRPVLPGGAVLTFGLTSELTAEVTP
ncbi:carbohydrate-binding protein [Nonomuraea sp. NPDC049607]|uniref:carbohydrate-binding protein n=1 Tax=Nonomuraea sp. NPDC049607 TaxID=3154732 RepID=UPI00343A95E6